MSDKQRLTALIKFLKAASPEVIAAHIALAEEKQGVSFPFLHAAADTPPLWVKRKPGWNTPTGQKASPALWIKMHYGNKDVHNWDPMGLKIEDIRGDMPLYGAFAKWIERHPEDDFDPEARRTLLRYTDPKEAFERIRRQKSGSRRPQA